MISKNHFTNIFNLGEKKNKQAHNKNQPQNKKKAERQRGPVEEQRGKKAFLLSFLFFLIE